MVISAYIKPRVLLLLAAWAVMMMRGHAGTDTDWHALALVRLQKLEARAAAIEQELAQLGAPVVGQTAAEFGYQHPRLEAQPVAPSWVQVDLQTRQALDWVALVPAHLDWQSIDRPAYGFPRRFRVDLSDDPAFGAFTPIADYTDADIADPGIAPVLIRAGGAAGRYLRLTVTKLAVENGQHFFALGEIMAIAGARNVAVKRHVRVSHHYELLPRWSAANLTDGRMPLGPPIRRELLEYDGLYTSGAPDGPPSFMQVDLGRGYDLQEVRLHPVHARIGADVPGFTFPRSFRIEVDSGPDQSPPDIYFQADNFPNPGSNVVTIPLEGVHGRVVRIVASPTEGKPQPRFGLSEVEIYAGGVNVARSGEVMSTPDAARFSAAWPRSLLVDGYTSYGKIIELPAWLEDWSRRRSLQAELNTLASQRSGLQREADRQMWTGLVVLVAAAVAVSAVFWWRARRRRARELNALRLRLARDLHDEIGSNLAGIAVLSEMGGSTGPETLRGDWQEVHRITSETIHSMREALWVLGARQEAGLDLLEQLPRAAQRMLAGCEVTWMAVPDKLPDDWPIEQRRQVFLFFKEALANVARHARARHVELSARLHDGAFVLKIHDDGVGFPVAEAKGGAGLSSMRERARLLRGRLQIISAPGQGTSISLRVPIRKRAWPRWPFRGAVRSALLRRRQPVS